MRLKIPLLQYVMPTTFNPFKVILPALGTLTIPVNDTVYKHLKKLFEKGGMNIACNEDVDIILYWLESNNVVKLGTYKDTKTLTGLYSYGENNQQI